MVVGNMLYNKNIIFHIKSYKPRCFIVDLVTAIKTPYLGLVVFL